MAGSDISDGLHNYCSKSPIALCTSNLSITARCKLDLTLPFGFILDLVFGFKLDDFASSPNPEPHDAAVSIDVSIIEGEPEMEEPPPEVVSRRWTGTIIGVVRGGGGHYIDQF